MEPSLTNGFVAKRFKLNLGLYLTSFPIVSILCTSTNKLNQFMTVLLAYNRYLSHKGNNHRNTLFYFLCTVLYLYEAFFDG